MNKNQISQAVVAVLAMWSAGGAFAADPAVKIDRFPPVTGGGEFSSNIEPEPIKPNVFVVLDNSGSMYSATGIKNLDVGNVNLPFKKMGGNNSSSFSRMQVVAAGILNGFPQLEGKIRLGYMAITPVSFENSPRAPFALGRYLEGTSAGRAVPSFNNRKQYNLIPRDFSDEYAQQFYDWIAWVAPTGKFTPLVEAAEDVVRALQKNNNGETFIMRRDNNTFRITVNEVKAVSPTGAAIDFFSDTEQDKSSDDYGYPLASNKRQSCRANFEIMIADGGYNVGDPKLFNSGSGQAGYDVQKLKLPEELNVNGKKYNEYNPYDPDYGYIYRDGYFNRLSDVAFYGWINDLRPDLPNDVVPYWNAEKVKDSSGKETDEYKYRDASGNPIPRMQGPGGKAIPPAWDRKNDPATWQHLTFYAIGLLDGLPQWKDLQELNDNYPELVGERSIEGYFRQWDDSTRKKIGGYIKTENVEEDFAKAGKIGRGDALPVDDPESFKRVIDRIAARIEAAYEATRPLKSTISGTVSTNSITSTQEGGAMLYTASVDVEEHTGDVEGYSLCASRDKSQCNSSSAGQKKWSAAEKMYQALAANGYKGHEDAKIYTLKRDGGTLTPVEFKWDNLGNSQKKALYSGSEGEAIAQGRVDYIRGKFVRSGAIAGDINDTNVSSNTLDPSIYRPRGRFGKTNSDPGNPNFLGEIVYSQPRYVANRGTLSNFHPLRESSGYKNFLRNSVEGVISDTGVQSGGRQPLVIFGSDDGKVYALDGKSGEAVFQYIPLGSYEKLAETTKPGFSGGTLVGGIFEVKDVMFDDGSWHTLAVGTMGAGGKSVFAFDLNKENLSNPEKLILWEKTADTDLGKTLGNVMAKPRIVWLANTKTADKSDGKWVVLIPNGYNSTSNSASLIILDAQTGDIMAEIDTKAVASNGEANGLGPLTVQDLDFDGGVDFAYAGDLQGNVWKFDLRDWEDDKLDLAYQSDARLSKLNSYYDARTAYNAAKLEQQTKKDALDIAKAALDAASPSDSNYANLKTTYDNALSAFNNADQVLAQAEQAMDNAYSSITAAEPFFVAKDDKGKRQPITAEITIADSADGEGAMLYFGTGKLFSTENALESSSQSFYAVYENYRFLSDRSIKNQLGLPIDRADLFSKEIVELGNPNSNKDSERDKWVKDFGRLRGIKDKGAGSNLQETTFSEDKYVSFDLNGKKLGGDKLGWYIDFPKETYKVYGDGVERDETGVRERVINEATVLDDGVYFLSFSPRQGAQVQKQANCDGTSVTIEGGDSGITRFYMLDRLTGNYLDNALFDLSGDGVTDEHDMVTLGKDSNNNLVTKPGAGLQLTGGYGTLAGTISTLKKTGKNYADEDDVQFKSESLLCETERQVIFPSATDKDGNTLVLKGCYENRFRVWKQVQQEF